MKLCPACTHRETCNQYAATRPVAVSDKSKCSEFIERKPDDAAKKPEA